MSRSVVAVVGAQACSSSVTFAYRSQLDESTGTATADPSGLLVCVSSGAMDVSQVDTFATVAVAGCSAVLSFFADHIARRAST